MRCTFEFIKCILIHVNHNCFCLYFYNFCKGQQFSTHYCMLCKNQKNQLHPLQCFWHTKKITYVQSSKFITEHSNRLSDQFFAMKFIEFMPTWLKLYTY